MGRLGYVSYTIVGTILLVAYLRTPGLTLGGRDANKRNNVLLLIADDFRPQFSPYQGSGYPALDNARMRTPNLDALAAKSLVLKRAYVQQAHCSPSRASFLTGRRPDTTHVYDIRTSFRQKGGNFTTLPQYFKECGYDTIGMGKVFHGSDETGGVDDQSWSEPYTNPPYLPHWNNLGQGSWRAVPTKDTETYPLQDQWIAQKAIETLHRFGNNNSNNFFLAVGFRKPHLPFVFPDKYLDLYPEQNISLPLNPFTPSQMPKYAWSKWNELREYADITGLGLSGNPNVTLPDAVTLQLRRAYYASVSFIDDQVGLVLDALVTQGLADSTVVVFLGDHGWMLGEHGGWCKHNNFEVSTHAPLVIHVPGVTDGGMVTEKLVEFVDIFPTLAEVAGLPSLEICPEESSKVALCREGSSLVPLMSHTPLWDTPWKDRAFSQYPRKQLTIMGYSMRTDRYRYTEWVSFDPTTFKPVWTSPLEGVELYDHRDDPMENHNVATDRIYRETTVSLSRMLREGWRVGLR